MIPTPYLSGSRGEDAEIFTKAAACRYKIMTSTIIHAPEPEGFRSYSCECLDFNIPNLDGSQGTITIGDRRVGAFSFVVNGVFDFYITKDDAHYFRLAKLIQSPVDDNAKAEIRKLVHAFMFTVLTHDLLTDLLDQTRQRAFEEGQRSKVREIREVLDI